MAKPFPTTIHVKRERESSTGDYYFVPGKSLSDLVEMGERIEVAEYKLVGTRKCEGVVLNKPLRQQKSKRR